MRLQDVRRTAVVSLVAILSLLATSCATIENLFDGAAAADDADGPQLLTAATCERITLTTDSAQPLERLPIDGWDLEPPTTLAGPAPVAGFHLDGVDPAAEGLEFRPTGDDQAPRGDAAPNLGWVPVHELASGPAFDVPVHPLGDPEGGEVEVIFGQVLDDGELRWCDARRTLGIQPLPDADPDSTITAWLDRTREDLATVLQGRGTNLDALQRLSTDEVTAEDIPLYIAAQLLREDAVPEMVTQLDPRERELADRLFTRAAQLLDAQVMVEDGFPEADEVVLASVSASESTGVAPRTTNAPSDIAQVGASADVEREAVLPAAFTRVDLPGAAPDQAALQLASDSEDAACEAVTAPELESLLGEQFSGHALTNGGPETLTDLTMFVGGLPVVGGVAMPAGYAAWIAKAVGEYLTHMRPAQLDRSRLLVNTDELYEDDEDRGVVQGLELGFSSNGWDAGPLITDLAMMAGGQAATARLQRYLRQQRAMNPRPGERGTTEFWGETVWIDMDVLDASIRSVERVAEIDMWVLGELVGRLADSTGANRAWARFQPRCWNLDAPADSLDGVEVEYHGAIEEGGTPLRFRPFDLGTGEVTTDVDLAVGEQVLGFVSQDVRDMEVTFGLSRAVEVLPLEVRWTPGIARAEPGDVVAFDLEVFNARDGRVDVYDDLDVLDLRALDASGGTTVGYPVPSDWNGSSPIALEAMSISETGLRALDHPNERGPLSGSAFILPGDFPALFIRPGVTCLDTGEAVRFAAKDQPLFGDDVAVVWDADRGAIEPDGRFTAPDDAGPVTVRATAVEDQDITAAVTFDVGACDECRFEIRIDGLLEGQDALTWSSSDERFRIRHEGSFPHEWRSGVDLAGVDWETGSFERLTVQSQFLNLEVVDVAGDGLPASFDVVSGAAVRVPTMYEYWTRGSDSFNKPRSFVAPILYSDLWANRRATMPEAAGQWDPPTISAQVHTSGLPVDENEPKIEYSLRMQGPLLVGRRASTTVDGNPFHLTRGVVAEPILGSITIRIDGVFYPFHSGRGADRSEWRWDTDSGRASCGGSDAYRRQLHDDMNRLAELDDLLR